MRGHLSGVSTARGTGKAPHGCPGAFRPEQPAVQGPSGGDCSAAQLGTLATEGSLPPAWCSALSWTDLHHVALHTVNSCIIAWAVHRGAVVTFDMGLGQVWSQQRGKSGVAMLWGAVIQGIK